jgi:hypothetical protein
MPNDISGQAQASIVNGSNALGTGQTSDTATMSQVDLDNLKQYTLDQLQRLRNFRRPYDQRRALYYRQYIGQRDRRTFPDNMTPRSNTYVPYPASKTEAIVSRMHDAFFSIDPYLEVRPNGGNDYAAMQMQNVMLTGLHRAKLTKVVEVGTRDLCIYGHWGLKVDWDWDTDTVTGPEPIYQMQPQMDAQGQVALDPQTRQPIMTDMPMLGPDGQPIQIGTQLMTKVVPRNCPKLIPIDIYDLLVDPDEKIVAMVTEISWGELRRQAANNPKLYRPEAILQLTQRLAQYRDLDRDGIIIRMAEVWDDTKKTVTQVTFGEDADAIGWKDRRYQWRNASYSAYKRRVYNGPPCLLYTGPNPFAHQRCPILHTAFVKVKGDVYGIGLIEKISDLTEGVNTFVNMITDNWNLGINQRYAYDVQVDIDHDQLDNGNTPGGKVGVVGDPSKAIYPFPHFTPGANDYQIIDLYRGMIDMNSGLGDIAQGRTQPGQPASSVSDAINESGYILKLLIRNMELDILCPMMEMVSALYQQYGTDELEYSITNAPPGIPKYGKVKLESIIGNYSFDFVAANYATGKVVKQRNLMAFYNIAMQSPYAVQSEFLKEIARSMEIPYPNRLLKSDQQVQGEQQQRTQQQVELEVMKRLLAFESKALVEQLKKKEPNSVTDHAIGIQQEIEKFLADQAGVPVEPTVPAPHNHEGAPRKSQFEGQIPGGNPTDQARSASQQAGLNALGISGTGE